VKRALIVVFLLLLSRNCEAQTVAVNWWHPQQTIDGFGGAAVTFTLPLPDKLADFFFDRSSGIGLSILRVQVIPDTKTCSTLCQTFPSKGCGCEATNGSTILSGELQTIRQAQSRGVGTFVASSWSPPGFMKRSNSWVSGGTFKGGTSN
jgi:glucuronoarabinoxylan endo-1,4-beta-xylanase